MAEDSFLIGASTLREMLRILRKVEGMAFRGNVDFVNAPTGISGFVKGGGEGGESDPVPTLRLFHITGERGAGGMYIMKQVTSDGTGISSATPESLGTDSDTEVTGLNLQELNLDTHWLTDPDNVNQLYCLGFPWGQDSEGRALFLICHIWVSTCEPTGGGTDGTDGRSFQLLEPGDDLSTALPGDLIIEN